MEPTLTYLSLGAGVQSTALYAITTLGLYDCPKASVAIFADTQSEGAHIYAHLARLRAWGEQNGGPRIDTVTGGNLGEDYLRGYRNGGSRKGVSALPAFVKKPDGKRGILNRHCTYDYKILPIQRRVKELLGYKAGQRLVNKGQPMAVARALIGISRDEAVRMKPSLVPWIVNEYPLVEAGIRRDRCLEIIAELGVPVPEKSACVFCPFADKGRWSDMKERHPADFERACQFDEAIRSMKHAGVDGQVYLHSSLVPLREVDLSKDTGQMDLSFGNECEGMCGV